MNTTEGLTAMIEEKKQAYKICSNFLSQVDIHSHLPPLALQYLFWNETIDYQTKSFEWLVANTSLASSLYNDSFQTQFLNILLQVKCYTDVEKLIKDESELKKFYTFIKIVPFKKRLSKIENSL